MINITKKVYFGMADSAPLHLHVQLEISLTHFIYKGGLLGFQSFSYVCCFLKSKQPKIINVPKRYILGVVYFAPLQLVLGLYSHYRL